MSAEFTPVLYVKNGCPHCFKLRLFLLEAGLINRFELHEFVAGEASEAKIKAELAPHFAKPTFPTVQYAPGKFQNESSDIIARYAAEAGIAPESLPLFVAYADGLQPRLRRLIAENKELLAKVEALSEAVES